MKIRATFPRLYSPDDPPGILPAPTPTPTPTADPPEPRNAGRVTCEGCGCSLDSQGKIIRRGDGLKAHLDREDDVKRLTNELAIANESVRELTAQVAAHKAKERKSILY